MRDTPRLHVALKLAENAEHQLAQDQSHYLRDVMRLKPGDPVRLFNAGDGEFLAYVGAVTRKGMSVICERKLADAVPPPDIDFIFAPLKHARLDYVVQKATELGARRLRPVFTARTIVDRVNLDRMRANAVEAAEQCNLVYVPDVEEPEKLGKLLAAWPAERALIYCDERSDGADTIALLKGLKLPAALLIGPEGGFTAEEREGLHRLPFVTVISLGPRIMRADTAGTAALALVQAVLGDWHS
ncbi:16S rRNA (uracil(1498)-N(3))-methyltransferase [Nordella sp. HKS 07]|uniref:16S rRNA (uracil(1498)-N(3))-methyltransferase n=1 Tax=Nordella sp. HKS 07 TaxID=2712222 RepID=UPI0013E20271|nr:16S rRNA (uracil(1498)-N(3))-methyltransferase [Nordella sp. HKS 07]QIG49151.1 16S rRNA (uracil(1498)-N(3))-methyltransferase [Nordella sp. HKS 07]